MWLSSSASRRSSKNRSPPPPPPRSTSPSTILAETLRKNPFRAPKDANPISEEDVEIEALNKDLHTLADFFPDVQIEVLRELLKRFDGDSRLPICTEQLYKYKAEWARGRLQNPPREQGDKIPLKAQFRSTAYTLATSKALALEFKSSNKSAISAVLAEVNHAYIDARPILQDIANKSKWTYFTNILGLRKKRAGDIPPEALLEKTKNGKSRLLSTGSDELDLEMKELFLTPSQRRQSIEQVASDLTFARKMNEDEAGKVEALFECKVCYNDVPFENISTCTAEAHTVCLDCVRRTLHEAIFGQGWAQSVAQAHATLRCLAPSDDTCLGHIPIHLVQRAVLDDKSGSQTWAKFEERLAEDSIHASNLPLVRCPFCAYAEADQIHSATTAHSLKWRFRTPTLPTITLILLLELVPALILFLLPIILLYPAYLTNFFYTSLSHLSLRNRTTRFPCLNPACLRKSCTSCSKPWHDPHICHEPLITSLRTTVEAARTAAIKRTCPRCGTSFVKSSGCNKLTCVCGYSMCYLCRQNIGKNGAAGNQEGAEGYRHFCEHFRPTPGTKCMSCDKCDLYRSEDEDEAVRRAGEEAERLWREKEGMVGVKGLEGAVGKIGGEESWWEMWRRGRWGIQETMDWVVEKFIVLDERSI